MENLKSFVQQYVLKYNSFYRQAIDNCCDNVIGDTYKKLLRTFEISGEEKFIEYLDTRYVKEMKYNIPQSALMLYIIQNEEFRNNLPTKESFITDLSRQVKSDDCKDREWFLRKAIDLVVDIVESSNVEWYSRRRKEDIYEDIQYILYSLGDDGFTEQSLMNIWALGR